MKLIVQVHRDRGLAFAQDELPEVNSDVAEKADFASLAAETGISQAELTRRAYRLMRFLQSVIEKVPQRVETVEKTAEELDAETKERRKAKREALQKKLEEEAKDGN